MNGGVEKKERMVGLSLVLYEERKSGRKADLLRPTKPMRPIMDRLAGQQMEIVRE